MPISNMQINCLLPAPCAEKCIVWKADQQTPPAPRAVVGLLTSQKKLRSMPTLRRTADVRGWPRVDGALWVLGQGVLPGPVEVVHLILHKAADLLVLKATGVICGEGKRLLSCCFFKSPPQGCLGACSKLHSIAVPPLWGSPGPQEEAKKEYICD